MNKYFVLEDNQYNNKDNHYVKIEIVNRKPIQGKIWKSRYPLGNLIEEIRIVDKTNVGKEKIKHE